jgi:EAL domain-containing protein (putative c-di-GMP-specific phosphodiesterase class I)
MSLSRWFVEAVAEEGGRRWRTVLRKTPFTIGRSPDSDLPLTSQNVSTHHARIELDGDGQLWLRDLESRNGTFINLQRIEGRQRLQLGDLLHFADQEFHLGSLEGAVLPSGVGETRVLSLSELGITPPGLTAEFRAMLQDGNLAAFFQPLVRLGDLSTWGYELLGRGYLRGGLELPGELFRIAEELELAVELSERLRDHGLAQATQLPTPGPLFVNTHPEELRTPDRLLGSLCQAAEQAGERRLVVEIHEGAVADLGSLADLSRELKRCRVEIAFDDFGTGQARLLELVEVAPRYVKFDVAWLSGSDAANQRRRALLSTLLGFCRGLEIRTIAEGVERQDQAEAVADLGFDFAQGFFFAPPAPVLETD